MSRKCDPKTEVYFPPEDKCVPRMTTKPMDIKETASYGAGAVVLGALAGWLFGRSQKDADFPEELERDDLIQQYDLNDFIPDVNSIDLEFLDKDDFLLLNPYISRGTLRRLEEVEDDYDFDRLFEDLGALQILMNNADNEDTIVVTEHIDNLQETLSFYEYIDDMLIAINNDME